MSQAQILKRGRGGRITLNIRALQRAIEHDTLTAGGQADILAAFPELANLVTTLMRDARRGREITDRLCPAPAGSRSRRESS